MLDKCVVRRSSEWDPTEHTDGVWRAGSGVCVCKRRVTSRVHPDGNVYDMKARGQRSVSRCCAEFCLAASEWVNRRWQALTGPFTQPVTRGHLQPRALITHTHTEIHRVTEIPDISHHWRNQKNIKELFQANVCTFFDCFKRKPNIYRLLDSFTCNVSLIHCKNVHLLQLEKLKFKLVPYILECIIKLFELKLY